MAITDEMKFEELRDSIETLLLANQSTHFRTIGEQKQSVGAEEIKGDLRTVQVFYSEGDPEHETRTEFEHKTTYQLFFSVSSPSTGDVATLESDSALPAAKQAALLNSTQGSRNADRSMDELFRMVTLILMDPVNEDLGLAKYTVSGRKIENFRKNQPIDHGNLIVITASARLTAIVTEIMIGATPTPAVEPAIRIDQELHTAGEDPDDLSPALTRTDIDTDP